MTQLNAGKQKLADAKVAGDAKLADAKAELDDGEATYAANLATFEAEKKEGSCGNCYIEKKTSKLRKKNWMR